MSKYRRQIDSLYRRLIQEAALLGASVDGLKGDALFSFDDYPTLKKRAERLIEEMRSGMSAVIVNGVNAERTLANNKNSELARTVFGNRIGLLTQAEYRRYFSTNGKAREAFLARKEGGLDLSGRVWRYTEQFKREIELGLDVGIRNGMSAADMARELKAWLREPDRLFRRVRDERGELKPSKAMAAYHPGQGVYRSSYKNALRLAATETNIAYRTADYERWQQLPFVVGIEIVLSKNHPVQDICDDLKGRYPKDFKFTGWHPNCRCTVLSILKTEEEMAEDTRRILSGEEPTTESSQTVRDVPQGFKDWVKENAERSKSVYSKPYFVSDNKKYISQQLLEAYGSKLPYATYAEYEQAMKFNKKHANFTPEQKKNIRELNEALPVIQGKVMNFTEADGNKVNPDFEIGKPAYGMNCATCVPTYLLRRRGFNLTAGEYIHKNGQVYELSQNGLKIWLKSDGTPIDYSDNCVKKHREWKMASMKSTSSEGRSFGLEAFVDDNTKETGIYMVRLKWKGNGAHFTIAERDAKGNLIYYDPQSGEGRWNMIWKDSVKLPECWLMRIDDKLISPQFASVFRKATRT